MTETVVIPNRGRHESERLTQALTSIAAAGLKPHCVNDSDLFLSESEAERTEAIKLCRGCPVIDPCRDVGKFQSWGIWGGRDVSRRPGRPKKTTT
jgi:hypothetical protein